MKLEGYVEHIIFRNDNNGYSVLEMNCDGELITAVGTFPYLDAGAYLVLDGEKTEHPVYGPQFKASGYEEAAPRDTVSIERYLGSGAIKGVGPKLAARIVNKFAEETFDIIENEPERLSEVKGISPRMAREIAAQALEKKELRDAMMFLQGFGIPANLSMKIYKKYGDGLYRVIRQTPYRLAEDIEGVGFRTADEIAKRAGINADDEGRIRSGILYTLSAAQAQGHTCLPEDELFDLASENLGVGRELVEVQLSSLCIDRKTVRKRQTDEKGVESVFVYAAASYYAELEVAAMLLRLDLTFEDDDGVPFETGADVCHEGNDRGMRCAEDKTRISGAEPRDPVVLDEAQEGAVNAAFSNGVMILTGGPGTGKTTTINAIIRAFTAEGLSIALAAPTGRAARRMTEATGCEACTIHRLLEVGGITDDDNLNGEFARNEDNPLEEDVVIIDEMSMVDLFLMRALLRAIVPGTRLILVGDENQLPSVGPGAVLKDLIASGKFRTVRLTRIFRQAALSDIVTNSHKIMRGERIALDNKSRDFFFLERKDPKMVLRVVLSLVKEKLPRYVGVEPYDIQVLTPTRKGMTGVDNLNLMLQHYLNPPSAGKAEIPFGQGAGSAGGEEWTVDNFQNARRCLRTGDKVMQIKNNYQLEWEVRNRFGIAVDQGYGIFNGDMGTVRSVNVFAEEITVEFDEGRLVDYPFSQLDELELAYALTVHKSQGSEYPAVVIPLLSGPKPLMNRNLIYTALTRARSCVTIVGRGDIFMEMVKNETQQNRYTGLAEALKSYLPPQVSGM